MCFEGRAKRICCDQSEEREVKMTLTFLVWAAGRIEFPFTDMGRAVAEQILQGKDRICFGAH